MNRALHLFEGYLTTDSLFPFYFNLCKKRTHSPFLSFCVSCGSESKRLRLLHMSFSMCSPDILIGLGNLLATIPGRIEAHELVCWETNQNSELWTDSLVFSWYMIKAAECKFAENQRLAICIFNVRDYVYSLNTASDRGSHCLHIANKGTFGSEWLRSRLFTFRFNELTIFSILTLSLKATNKMVEF